MASLLPMDPLNRKRQSSIVVIIAKGTSKRIRRWRMHMGVITVHIPRINPMLQMLDPMMFPRAREGLFSRAASMLTMSSGLLVPIATSVNPIMSLEAFNLRARETVPLTRLSPPR